MEEIRCHWKELKKTNLTLQKLAKGLIERWRYLRSNVAITIYMPLYFYFFSIHGEDSDASELGLWVSSYYEYAGLTCVVDRSFGSGILHLAKIKEKKRESEHERDRERKGRTERRERERERERMVWWGTWQAPQFFV